MKNVLFVFLLVLLTVFSTHAQSINDSLVFYYPCDGNLVDHSGNMIEASTNAILTEDEYGNSNSAYDLNGIDQWIDIVPSPLYRVDFPATFRMKFKVDSFPTDQNTFLFANDFVMNAYFGFHVVLTRTHKLSVSFGNGGPIFPYSRKTKMIDDTILAGSWYELVAIWYKKDDLHIYLNCDYQVGTYSGTGDTLVYTEFPTANAVVGVGDSHIEEPPVFFNGQVDEIAFWNRALTTQEIIGLCKEEIIVEIDEYELSQNKESIVKKIYPNPFSDHTVFELNGTSSRELHFRLLNAEGQTIRQESIHSSTFILDRKGIPPGIYIYVITDTHRSLIDKGKLMVR